MKDRTCGLPSRAVIRLSSRNRGSALLITLAFVVLLTVLILGFLSRVILEQHISTSSANQVNADLFAQGAEATIIGNLEEEIQSPANSKPVNTTGGNIYLPLTAANMVPQYEYTGAPTAGAPNAAIASLLKVSTSSPATGSTFPAASSALTTTSSFNGRSVSLDRWAGVYGPQLTDSSAEGGLFPTPRWIMVERGGGTSPTSFSSGLTYQPANRTSTTAVIGRYAYAIYDEGGLIDLNAAGYPQTASTTPASILAQASYPRGEAMADFTQLIPTTGSALTAEQIDTIVGWRNNASLSYSSATGTSIPPPTGTPESPAYIPAANAPNYFSFLPSLMTGFLTTGNANVTSTTHATDQRFTSRLELIDFLTTLMGSGNTGVLQYLTHFSRGLSQPSYVPPLNDPRIGGTPPKTSSSLPTTGTGTNTALGTDATINPSFLTQRVATAFTRNDGSAAAIGEPLVKKRFNLNRLAWITYKGPLSDGQSGVATTAAQVNSTDKDLTLMAQYLHDNYNLSYAFLQQGTAANVYKYFGLSWLHDTRQNSTNSYYIGDNQLKWLYDHQNVTGPYTAIPSATAGNFPQPGISHLQSLTGSREADFFELLKAATACGSKAKPAVYAVSGEKSGSALADNFMNLADSSLDNSIVQVGVNMIDQSKLDGFPSRILFADGSLPVTGPQIPVLKEFHGAENLPYIYGVRYSEIQNEMPTLSFPSQSAYTTTPIPGNVAAPLNVTTWMIGGTLASTGLNVSMILPEVWNPTDPSCPRCAVDSSGNPLKDSGSSPLFPTSFRIVAESTDPDHIMVSQGLPSYSGTDNILGSSSTTTAPTSAQLTGPAAYGTYSTVNYSTQANPEFSNPSGISGFIKSGFSPSESISALDPGGVFPQPPDSKVFPTIASMTTDVFYPLTAESTAMTFTDGVSATSNNFHEPTLLAQPNIPAGSNLAVSGSENVLNLANSFTSGKTIPSVGPNVQGAVQGNVIVDTQPSKDKFIGFYLNALPCLWYTASAGKGMAPPTTQAAAPNQYGIVQFEAYDAATVPTTFRLQYEYPVGSRIWRTYDDKFTAFEGGGNNNYEPASFQRHQAQNAPLTSPTPGKPLTGATNWAQPANDVYNYSDLTMAYDPRTNHFGMVSFIGNYNQSSPLLPATWGNQASNVLQTLWPDVAHNYVTTIAGSIEAYHVAETSGFSPAFTGNSQPALYQLGWLSLNNPAIGGSMSYSDPDGVTRFAMGGNTFEPLGNPMITATTGSGTAISQAQSRPIMLHRPFRSVGELGYVFSGAPWKNLDFFNANSGDSPLLDVFCVGDTPDPNGLIAGNVNLNTQQLPVIQAIVSGAYKDDQANYLSPPGWALPSLTSTEAKSIATALTSRTAATNTKTGQGPLENVSELIGKWTTGTTYSGFANDLNQDVNGNVVFGSSSATAVLQRMRESAIRGLAAAGQTRVWNVMIDVVAQTGRYPASATSFDNFLVEGEQRYWVHLAIDRLTGHVIDKQVEVIRQ